MGKNGRLEVRILPDPRKSPSHRKKCGMATPSDYTRLTPEEWRQDIADTADAAQHSVEYEDAVEELASKGLIEGTTQ